LQVEKGNRRHLSRSKARILGKRFHNLEKDWGFNQDKKTSPNSEWIRCNSMADIPEISNASVKGGSCFGAWIGRGYGEPDCNSMADTLTISTVFAS
jgi:hypothetical protein